MQLGDGEELRFVITGSTGLVGDGLRRFLGARYPVLALSRGCPEGDGSVPFDLLHISDFDFSCIGENDVVAHTAAISSPDICAKDPQLARAVNVDGTIAFIDGCRKRGASVLFFSTDLVFGPGKGLDEDSPYHPVGEYAAMKREVESHFAADDGVKVVRLSYVVSVRDKFTAYLAACARRGVPAEIFDPLYRSAVALEDVCRAVEAIGSKWDVLGWPAVNLCGPTLLSRQNIADIYTRVVDGALRYSVIYPGEEFFKYRPEVVELASNYLQDLLGREPLPIEEALTLEHNSQEIK